MKKYLFMTVFVAIALFAATACGDDKDDAPGGNGDTNVELKAPPYKDVATVLNLASNEAGIKQLRMMESGAYMITRVKKAAVRTRAGEELEYEFGKYTYKDGVFVYDNGMTISYTASGQNCDVIIRWQNGTSIETTGVIDTVMQVLGGLMTDNLCSRPWTIEKLRIFYNVDNNLKVGKEFNGSIDLHKVKVWYEEKFGSLKDEFNDNTIIQGIYFDSKGLFSINYQNRDDDVGVWRWVNMNDGSLSYTWNDKLKAISLFSGAASVAFQKNPEKCILTLQGIVNGNALEFEFTLR